MKKSLKTSYSIHRQVESFFTGIEIIFTNDGSHFFCSRGSIINKVSVSDGQISSQIRAKNEDDDVIRFTKTNDDRLLIIAYQSGLIMKFNLVDEVIEREFKSIHNAPVSCLKTNPTSTLLATASSDGTIKLWNLENHYCSHNLKGINGVVSCLEFVDSPHGNMLLCSGGDDCIHIYDLESSKKLTKLNVHCSTITDLKVVSNGTQLISVGRDKIAVVWNITRSDKSNFGSSIRTIPMFESIESIVLLTPNSLSGSLKTSMEEDRTLFATIGEEGLIKFWDIKTGSRVLTQNEPPLSDDRNPNVPCMQLCFRPSLNQICAVSHERDLFFYDLPDLKLIQQLQGHIDEILSACWFANDKYIAVACNSNDLKIMEVDTSRCQHLKGHSDVILSVNRSPANQMCLITSSKDCTLIIWTFDPATFTVAIAYKATGHTHSIHSVGISFSGEVFFSAGEDTTLKRWLMPDKQSIDLKSTDVKIIISTQTVKAHELRIDDIAVSPNDQLIATGSRDKTAKIFSADGLKILATLKGHRRGVYAVKFSPVDQVIVTAADVCLRMWNLHDFSCVKTFQGHDCSILNFSFLSTGLQLLSVGSDGNIKLWDCKTNECTKTIDAHNGSTWGFCLTDNDGYFLTGGQDQRLLVWKDTTQEEHEEKLTAIQTQVAQEQDFMNYVNKKNWRKALNMALKMENTNKTLQVLREIILISDGPQELEQIMSLLTVSQVNFMLECCLTWTSAARSSALGQHILNILLRQMDTKELLKMPGFKNSMDQLRRMTEKSLNRYEKLVQEATFVDFFLNSFTLQ